MVLILGGTASGKHWQARRMFGTDACTVGCAALFTNVFDGRAEHQPGMNGTTCMDMLSENHSDETAGGTQDEHTPFESDVHTLVIDKWDMHIRTDALRRQAILVLKGLKEWESRIPGRHVVLLMRACGSDVVPVQAEHRTHRDEYGFFAQAAANACDTVIRMWSGIPEILKTSPNHPTEVHAKR